MARTTKPRASGQGEKPSSSTGSGGAVGKKPVTKKAAPKKSEPKTPAKAPAKASESSAAKVAPAKATSTPTETKATPPATKAEAPKAASGAQASPTSSKPAPAKAPDTSSAKPVAAAAPMAAAAPAAAASVPPASVPSANARAANNSGSGPLSLILGGLVAGALGFAAAWLFLGRDDSGAEAQAALAARIEALEAELAAQQAPDLAPLSEAQAATDAALTELGTETTTRLDALNAVAADLETRLTVVERAPSGDGAVTDTAVASIERELEGLRAEIAAQESAIQSITDEAAAVLAAAEAQSTAAQDEAEAAARAAQVSAALARLQLALDSGAALTDPLAELSASGIDVPDALNAVSETGVATAATLQADFPAAARAALAAARDAGDDEEAGFMSSLFDVRSVEPQEGDGPDAVLSRVEAAVREDRLADALAEIETLPESAAAPLADWQAAANARLDALAATAALEQSNPE